MTKKMMMMKKQLKTLTMMKPSNLNHIYYKLNPSGFQRRAAYVLKSSMGGTQAFIARRAQFNAAPTVGSMLIYKYHAVLKQHELLQRNLSRTKCLWTTYCL